MLGRYTSREQLLQVSIQLTIDKEDSGRGHVTTDEKKEEFIVELNYENQSTTWVPAKVSRLSLPKYSVGILCVLEPQEEFEITNLQIDERSRDIKSGTAKIGDKEYSFRPLKLDLTHKVTENTIKKGFPCENRFNIDLIDVGFSDKVVATI